MDPIWRVHRTMRKNKRGNSIIVRVAANILSVDAQLHTGTSIFCLVAKGAGKSFSRSCWLLVSCVVLPMEDTHMQTGGGRGKLILFWLWQWQGWVSPGGQEFLDPCSLGELMSSWLALVAVQTDVLQRPRGTQE